MAIQRNRVRQSPVAAIHNSRGEEPVKISATLAKNKLGEVLDRVMQDGVVVITRHETPKAVLLSMDLEYAALLRRNANQTGRVDNRLRRDAHADADQKSRGGMKAAFNAPSKQLGKAALARARKRD